MTASMARRAPAPWLVCLAALGGLLALAHATRHGVGITPDSVVYLEAARNLADGRGLVTSDEGIELRPLTRFPPAYPAALALPTALGADSLDAARWLALALFGANVALVGLLIARSAPGSRWLPAIGAVLIACSPEMAMLHGAALSEPLFLLLGFSGLLLLSRHLEQPRDSVLLAAALATGLATLTRYVGLALVATGLLAILLAANPSARRRARDAAIFAAVGLLPIAAWALRNRLAGGSATGRSFAFHPIGPDAFALAASSAGEWLLAGRVGALAAGLLAAGLLACALHWLATGAARAPLPRILALFVPVYLLLLIASICFVDAATPLGGRILSPMLVALLALALGGVGARIRARRSFAIPAALLALVLAAGYARETTGWVRERAALGGAGFGSLAWRTSPTLRRVAELPAGARIYSNARDAVLILTGRTTFWLPAPVDAETRLPRPGYLPELERIRSGLRAEHTALVWFDGVFWRWYLPSGPDLRSRLPIRLETRLPDGEIWSYDPGRDLSR
jgi:hypothetical protein